MSTVVPNPNAAGRFFSTLQYTDANLVRFKGEVTSGYDTSTCSLSPGQSPADVLAAYLADPRSDEDEKIVAEAQKVALGIAGARRGAAHITPFRVGDKVRVINPYYTKHTAPFTLRRLQVWVYPYVIIVILLDLQ
eukprot:COSAG02_NODE_20977_length_807_cov_1.891243_2_plen_135_part_00